MVKRKAKRKGLEETAEGLDWVWLGWIGLDGPGWDLDELLLSSCVCLSANWSTRLGHGGSALAAEHWNIEGWSFLYIVDFSACIFTGLVHTWPGFSS